MTPQTPSGELVWRVCWLLQELVLRFELSRSNPWLLPFVLTGWTVYEGEPAAYGAMREAVAGIHAFEASVGHALDLEVFGLQIEVRLAESLDLLSVACS